MNSSIFKIIDINLEKIWGSKKIDNKIIGEVIKFEINEERSNNIEDYLGNSYNLYQLYSNSQRETVFGSKYYNKDKFPFLIKNIYSSQKLSLQVHPKEKKETWLFLKDNSNILLGLKDEIKMDETTVENLLNKSNMIKMNKYSFAVVEPGTIHSIFEDNDVCEVQNNYDVTYRFYDWDNNRKLTQEEFLTNANFNKYDIDKNTWNSFTEYDSSNFKIKKIKINKDNYFQKVDYCQVLIVLNGKGVINTNNESFVINQDESYLIIANVDYSITGDLDVLLIS